MRANFLRRILAGALIVVGLAFPQVRPAYLCAEEPSSERFAIALHGGAGSGGERLTDDERRAKHASLERALKIGRDILTDGGSSLDAVEQVIRSLEDDPLFNAGRGAVFNAEGRHELDASIMDGRERTCGAVAAARTVKNPISLARLVMTRTRHVLLVADGVERFADEMKVPRVDNSYFSTDARRQDWEKARKPQPDDASRSIGERYLGTVGCVALDRHGNLAAGTSTGGLTNKRFGRVGDSPIISAGTYADNASCAVSCTGVGEEFIRNAVAYDVSARMRYAGQSLEEAVRTVIHERLRPGDGGLIAVGRDGSIAIDFNTPGMARAAADSTGRFEVSLEARARGK